VKDKMRSCFEEEDMMSYCCLQEKGRKNHFLVEKGMTSYYFLEEMGKKSHHFEVLGTNCYLEVEDRKNYCYFRVLDKMIHHMVKSKLSYLMEMDTMNHLLIKELDTSYV
jgi:hypothetical protein